MHAPGAGRPAALLMILLLPLGALADGGERPPAAVAGSASYGLRAAVFGSAGGRAGSAAYGFDGTMGQPHPVGRSAGPAYALFAGFWTGGGVLTDAGDAPPAFSLMQNYPNPFNPVTTIRYSTAGAGRVELTIYDVSGRRVRALVGGEQPAGAHSVVWDGRNDGGRQVAAGVYFYRLAAGGERSVKKMVVLR